MAEQITVEFLGEQMKQIIAEWRLERSEREEIRRMLLSAFELLQSIERRLDTLREDLSDALDR
jgi:hypothetical protein